MKFLPLFIIVNIFTLLTVFGQKTPNPTIQRFYPYKNEIGINFTNVLGNVLSLNPNNANSPYGFTYRRHGKKMTFRSAFNINISSSEDSDFLSGSFINKTISDQITQARVGLEKHIVLSPKFLFSYGIDFLASYIVNNSSVSSFDSFGGSTTFTNDKNTVGFGIGPMLRLEYKISDRIFISSETSLYGFYSNTTDLLRISGQADEKTTSNKSSFISELPQSLFFNISF
jgi:hypothetical protein